MEWIDDQASVLGMRAKTHLDRGNLVVEVEIVNAGTLPLEDIRMKLNYDGGQFRLRGKSKQWLSHMLPGDVAEHIYILEPRGHVDASRLVVRSQASAGETELTEEVDLGMHSLKPRGIPYHRAKNRQLSWQSE